MTTGRRHPLLAPMTLSLTLLLTGADAPVKFDRYDDYSVKNSPGRDAAFSCMAITDRKEFDDHFVVHYFGFGADSKAPSTLPDDAFETRMVVAVVRRGEALWTYDVQGLSADGEKLTLRYKATPKAHPGTTFACPLVVSLPKGRYTSVKFVEDGKEVGKASVGEARKP